MIVDFVSHRRIDYRERHILYHQSIVWFWSFLCYRATSAYIPTLLYDRIALQHVRFQYDHYHQTSISFKLPHTNALFCLPMFMQGRSDVAAARFRSDGIFLIGSYVAGRGYSSCLSDVRDPSQLFVQSRRCIYLMSS